MPDQSRLQAHIFRRRLQQTARLMGRESHRVMRKKWNVFGTHSSHLHGFKQVAPHQQEPSDPLPRRVGWSEADARELVQGPYCTDKVDLDPPRSVKGVELWQFPAVKEEFVTIGRPYGFFVYAYLVE